MRLFGCHHSARNPGSQPDPFHLVERKPFPRPVIELGGARAFMRRHGLSAKVDRQHPGGGDLPWTNAGGYSVHE